MSPTRTLCGIHSSLIWGAVNLWFLWLVNLSSAAEVTLGLPFLGWSLMVFATALGDTFKVFDLQFLKWWWTVVLLCWLILAMIWILIVKQGCQLCTNLTSAQHNWWSQPHEEGKTLHQWTLTRHTCEVKAISGDCIMKLTERRPRACQQSKGWLFWRI